MADPTNKLSAADVKLSGGEPAGFSYEVVGLNQSWAVLNF